MGRSKLAIAALLFSASSMAQVQVWNQDLNGSTNANKIVSGIQNHAIAAPTSAGGLYWSGTTWLYTSGVPAVCGGDLTTSGGVCGAVQSLTPTGGLSTIVPFNAGGFKLATTPWVLQDSGSVTRFSLETAHGRGTFGGGGSDTSAIIGPVPGSETGNAGIWFAQHGAGAVAGAQAMYEDTGGDVILNTSASTQSFVLAYGAATAIASINYNTWLLGTNTTAAPLQLSWATSTAPLIQSGTLATSLTLGTNKSGASTIIQADAEQTFVTLANTGITVGFGAASSSGTGNNLAITGQTGGGAAADGGPITLTGGTHVGSKADGSIKVTTPFNAGYVAIAAATTINATNAQSNANVINITGTFSGAITLNLLREIADTSLVVIRNSTTNGTITVAYLSGGTVGSITPSTSCLIASDGANLQKIMNGT